MKLYFGTISLNLKLIELRKFRGRHPAGPSGDAKHQYCGDMLNEFEWPSFETQGIWPHAYKTVSMLNSTEHEINHAHKC